VGLGTWKVFNVRDDVGQARCEAVVDAALADGANFFDSSPMYGEAERVLAQAIEERRDQCLVATKVWARSRAIGEQQISQAMDWYQNVDLYQIHNLLETEEHMPYLRHLKDGGRVRLIGATHYLESAFPDLMSMMRRREIDCVQVPYHPLQRGASRELLPEAEHLGIGVVVMMPLDTGKLLHRSPTEEELAPLEAFGVRTWAQVLIKWVLSDDRVHVVIPATSNPDHMRENAAAGEEPWFGGDERTYVRQLAQKYA
jgi:aryl-alcohol dehydrogenase-like predicted oxidoreductase